jgi:serine/threonine-protein kinase RsbW
MADHLTLQFQSTSESLATANAAVSQWLADRGTSEAVRYFARLAVEELATNCMKYAYDDTNEHTLLVSLSFSEGVLELTFTDDGRPFNPLLVPDPDLRPTAEERPIGGLGIYLLRQLSGSMKYTRAGNKNIVTLQKAIDAP